LIYAHQSHCRSSLPRGRCLPYVFTQGITLADGSQTTTCLVVSINQLARLRIFVFGEASYRDGGLIDLASESHVRDKCSQFLSPPTKASLGMWQMRRSMISISTYFRGSVPARRSTFLSYSSMSWALSAVSFSRDRGFCPSAFGVLPPRNELRAVASRQSLHRSCRVPLVSEKAV
jgi:hypothetical protein